MNGAEALVRTLVAQGVDLCLANPGTSEMHLVQAIDAVDGMRGVLVLFEGVASGAADGYGRMRGRPAATLLHLGAGFANAAANLHNARRARAPIINLVGDHTAQHQAFDALLTSDINAIAAPFSAWVRHARTSAGLAGDALDAVRATLTRHPGSAGQIATLRIPVDVAWGDAAARSDAPLAIDPPKVDEDRIVQAAEALGPRTLVLADTDALGEAGSRLLAQLAAHTGARVMAATFPARQELGPQLPRSVRMPYFPEQQQEVLASFDTLLLAGAEPPVSYFSYRDVPSDLVPEHCRVLRLNLACEDGIDALERLVDRAGAGRAVVQEGGVQLPELPTGALSQRHVASLVARRLPEAAIVTVDSGAGGAAFQPCQGAAPHTWLNMTGGSIGIGGPLAVGAALACPDRRVVALLGDGGAMYTPQYLWTAAREGLDVVSVIYSNRRYNILEVEYRRLGINEIPPGAAALFDLSRPDIDWAALGTSMGVPSKRVDTCEDFDAALAEALATPGPALIEAVV